MSKLVGLVLLTAASVFQPTHAVGIVKWVDSANVATQPVMGMPTTQTTQPQRLPKHANFEQETVSQAAQQLADWVVDSSDNNTMPFLIVDKINAKVFAFNPQGNIIGAAAALLGLARGDDSVQGIGERKLSAILPEERITPAGRFVADLGQNLAGKDILWVDYDAAISLHRVITTNAKEQRAQRLATPTSSDNRISFGCINVPVRFYEDVVYPAFNNTNGVVYVLPEIRSMLEIFPLFKTNKLSKRTELQDMAR